MRSLCFLFVTSLLPLCAQVSIDDSAKAYTNTPPLRADNAPDREPAAPVDSSAPARPAPPQTLSKVSRVAILPSTIRQGFTYREGAKTIVTLDSPATKQFTCKVVSSNPDKLVCGAVTFLKGDQEGHGSIDVLWKNIDQDCQISIKVYDPLHPGTILLSRIYLRISPKDTDADEDTK